MDSDRPFLTLTRHRDRQNRVIVLLHSGNLPPATASSNTIQKALHIIPPNEEITLVYLHAGLASASEPSLFSVRTFRRQYEQVVPLSIRSRIQQIVALHVSFSTRSLVYASTFQMQCSEYRKLVYCDLLVDLEQLIGVDSTLLDIRDVDLDYDQQMRYWVGRENEGQSEAERPKELDPSKPLINTEDVIITAAQDQIQESASPSTTEP